MSKFLNLIEDYNPENSGFYTDVHDFKMLLKSHDIKFGVRSGGVFYIDDPANNKTYVVEIKSVDTGSETEEDGESYDVVDATSSMNPRSAKAKADFLRVANAKLPKALNDLTAKTAAIAKM